MLFSQRCRHRSTTIKRVHAESFVAQTYRDVVSLFTDEHGCLNYLYCYDCGDIVAPHPEDVMTEKLDPLASQVARLRHLYRNLVNGGIRDSAHVKRIATGLLEPAIEGLEKLMTPGAAPVETPKPIDVNVAMLDAIEHLLPAEINDTKPFDLVGRVAFMVTLYKLYKEHYEKTLLEGSVHPNSVAPEAPAIPERTERERVDAMLETQGKLETPIKAGFVPWRAAKIGGSYQATGTVVAEFSTLAGKERVVFEFDEPKGMLHIFDRAQISTASLY